MKNRLLVIMTYLGLLTGAATLGAFLLYASNRYPTLADNQLSLSIGAGIIWFAVAVFILNKAYESEPDPE